MIQSERDLSAFRFTFLYGVRVRSGTNYLGKVISYNPHVQSVPPTKTTDELPLLQGLDNWESAFEAFVGKYNGKKRHRREFRFDQFLPHLGRSWLTFLVESFALRPGHVFLKDPSVRHIDKFFTIFPDAKLILLVRDGRDNVASSVKAGLARRARRTLSQRTKTRLKHLLFRDFMEAARGWAAGVAEIRRFDEKMKGSPFGSRYLVVRYEDLYRKPRQLAARIFSFMEVAVDSQTLDSVENAEVVGSSFFGPTGREDAKKPIWTPSPRTEAFQPIGRWKTWNAFQKIAFKRIAGDQLIAFGYENDLNW